MRTCPNCGAPNDPNDRFCANCGAPLQVSAPGGERQPSSPPDQGYGQQPWPSSPYGEPGQQGQQGYPPYQGTQPGGPPPWGPPGGYVPPAPPKRRRSGLVTFLLVLIGGCLLICVGFFIFALTPYGSGQVESWSTWVAEQGTEIAETQEAGN